MPAHKALTSAWLASEYLFWPQECPEGSRKSSSLHPLFELHNPIPFQGQEDTLWILHLQQKNHRVLQDEEAEFQVDRTSKYCCLDPQASEETPLSQFLHLHLASVVLSLPLFS
ncbi:hypothetical protein V8G54_003349 [Vigna mungo]|uniref:Uncharacterized protein n=1 Tax=Vigna mungo TaxID=3915 RepID=A0AAQ3PBX3_VIGMU